MCWDMMPVIGWFIPDVSRQHIGLIFKALNVQEHWEITALNVQEHWEITAQWQSIISQKKKHLPDYRLLNSWWTAIHMVKQENFRTHTIMQVWFDK